MVYIERDSNQNIVGIFQKEQKNAKEKLHPNNPAIAAFLFGKEPGSDLGQSTTMLFLQDLHMANIEMTHVMDELLDTLVKKQVITAADLPEFAMQRLNHRAATRKDLQSLSDAVKGAVLIDD